jgi:glycosyltransferase involved in cell wall biosynthesis
MPSNLKDISILIVNYNREQYVERCLRSCIDQIVFNKSFEIIFVDDGSTDKSLKIAKKFSSNAKIFSLKKNKGIAAASNYAIKKSTGKYFIRVDSDDFINKHCINNLAHIIECNPGFAFVYSDHYRVDEFGFKEKLVRLNTKEKVKNHGAGILFDKNIFLKYGSYNEKLAEGEDYEIISKIMKKENFFYLPTPLYRYYIHKNNISHSGNRKIILKLLKKSLNK